MKKIKSIFVLVGLAFGVSIAQQRTDVYRMHGENCRNTTTGADFKTDTWGAHNNTTATSSNLGLWVNCPISLFKNTVSGQSTFTLRVTGFSRIASNPVSCGLYTTIAGGASSWSQIGRIAVVPFVANTSLIAQGGTSGSPSEISANNHLALRCFIPGKTSAGALSHLSSYEITHSYLE